MRVTPAGPTTEPSGQAVEAPAASSRSGRRLGVALFGYMMVVTLIITLLPFQFAWPQQWRLNTEMTVIDVVGNILLFLPLGFLFRAGAAHRSQHAALRVMAGGLLLSLSIEMMQLFEVERYTSPVDVLTNASGALLGALLYQFVDRSVRIDGRTIGRLSLELPLMGLVYLLVPLLWLNALAGWNNPLHALTSLLLGVVGATVLGGLQYHHFGPDRGLRARWLVAIAVVWFVGGTFPGLSQGPTVTVVGALVVALLAWYRGVIRPVAPWQRRYEVPVLTSALPAYAAYLVLVNTIPLREGIGAWTIGWGFGGTAESWGRTQILGLLELVAGFTLLGYMIAEYRGRSHQSLQRTFARLTRLTLVACVIVEGLRGFQIGYGASVLRVVVLFAASTYGAWLYFVQRSHVRKLLGERDEPPVTTTAEWRAA